ncbi:hypothetical protein DFH09DRAFT_1412165 [Mycena vulgaris]|nr:hypothetical protein DFH09DRAFT_1412165 [Mycena vulgaris]
MCKSVPAPIRWSPRAVLLLHPFRSVARPHLPPLVRSPRVDTGAWRASPHSHPAIAQDLPARARARAFPIVSPSTRTPTHPPHLHPFLILVLPPVLYAHPASHPPIPSPPVRLRGPRTQDDPYTMALCSSGEGGQSSRRRRGLGRAREEAGTTARVMNERRSASASRTQNRDGVISERAHPHHVPIPVPLLASLLLLLHNVLHLPTHSSPSAGGTTTGTAGTVVDKAEDSRRERRTRIPSSPRRSSARAGEIRASLHVHSGQALHRPLPRTRERKGPGTRGGAAKRRVLDPGEGGGCRFHEEGACGRKVEDVSSRTCPCTRSILCLPALVYRVRARISSPASSLCDPEAGLPFVRWCAAPPHPHPFEPKRGRRKRLERWRGPTEEAKEEGAGRARDRSGEKRVGTRAARKADDEERTGGCGYGACSRPTVRERWDGRRRGREDGRTGARGAGGVSACAASPSPSTRDLERGMRKTTGNGDVGWGWDQRAGAFSRLLPVLHELCAPSAPISSLVTTPHPRCGLRCPHYPLRLVPILVRRIGVGRRREVAPWTGSSPCARSDSYPERAEGGGLRCGDIGGRATATAEQYRAGRDRYRARGTTWTRGRLAGAEKEANAAGTDDAAVEASRATSRSLSADENDGEGEKKAYSDPTASCMYPHTEANPSIRYQCKACFEGPEQCDSRSCVGLDEWGTMAEYGRTAGESTRHAWVPTTIARLD